MRFNFFIIRIASICGVFQGVAWTVLSLIGICWHAKGNYVQNISLYSDKYETVLNSYLYESFIRDRDRTAGLFIQPTAFFALMVIYFCFHLIWTVSSILLYFGRPIRYIKITLKEIALSWIIISLMILILDIVTFSLFVHDYQFCIREYNDTNNQNLKLPYLYSIIVYGIMMTLSARGYILWLINLIVIGLILKIWITHRSTLINEQRNAYETTENIQVPRAVIGSTSHEFPSQSPTEPSNSESPTFRYLKRHFDYDDISYVYDPQIESRLAKYIVKGDNGN